MKQKKDCFTLGRILKKHGYKGEAILLLETQDTSPYLKLESVFVELNQILVPFFISSISPLPKGKLKVAFEDIQTEAQIEPLIGKKLYLDLSQMPPIDPDDFYYHQILDYQIVDKEFGEIGVLKEIRTSGAQDFMAILHPSGNEVLVPLIQDWILETDHPNKRLKIETPEGLIALYL